MRFLRVVGTLLVVSSSANAFFWLFDTLIPIHRVTKLQPLPTQALTETPIGETVLLECHRDDISQQSDPSLLLDCVGQPVWVQSSQASFQTLSMMLPPTESTSFRQFSPGSPIVAVGNVVENQQEVRVSADLVAYGNRDTYLGELREKSMAQVIWTYALGAMGIAALLVDWQLSLQSRRLEFATQQAQSLPKSLPEPSKKR